MFCFVYRMCSGVSHIIFFQLLILYERRSPGNYATLFKYSSCEHCRYRCKSMIAHNIFIPVNGILPVLTI